MAVPPAPTGLSATAVDAGRVDLAWTDNAPGADGYSIERKPLGAFSFQADWGEIAIEPPLTDSFTDDRTASETFYEYRVMAFNGDGNSLPSNVAQLTTPAAPPLDVEPPPVPLQEVRVPLVRPAIDFLSPNVFGVEGSTER